MAKYNITISYDSESYTTQRGYDSSNLFNYDKESEYVFYRRSLNADLVFIAEGFWFIDNAPFETKFDLSVQEVGIYSGSNIGDPWIGFFYKTDCKFTKTTKTKKVIVKAQVEDVYKNVLNSLDKEINILKHRPLTTKVSYSKQPLIQIYLPGSSLIQNILGGVVWESEVTPTESDATLTNDYLFTKSFDKIIITGSEASLAEDISGIYNGVTKVREDGVYTIIQDTVIRSIWYVRKNSSGLNVFTGGGLDTGLFGFPQHSDYNRTFFNVADITEQVRAFRVSAYARILTDVSSGNQVIPAVDISEFGYTHVASLVTTDFTLNDTSQTTNSSFGQFDKNSIQNPDLYFPAYDDVTYGRATPILKSTWSEFAIWFSLNSDLVAKQQSLAVEYTDRTTYKLSDVLYTLLEELETGTTFLGNSAHSQFLYGLVNPISGIVEPTLTLTPNSNILAGNYDTPTSKANIKLGDVLTMLKNVYNLDWIINEDNKLIIEHSLYFENGGSYTTATVGTDLTTLVQPANELVWSYSTEEWEYDKAEMPEQIRFKWQHKVSEPFDGYPIDVMSAFVEKGNIKENNIGVFTSDLDYMQAISGEISNDGFTLLGVDITTNKVAFFNIVKNAEEYWLMQNGQLSLVYLVDKFHKYNLPAANIKVNEAVTTATTVQRNKIQEVSFPSLANIDPIKLIRTSLGTGKIDKIETNLSSKHIKTTIRHATES